MNEKEFEYNGIKLKAIPMSELKEECEECYFYNNGCGHASFSDLRPSCLAVEREDKTSVVFVKIKELKIKLKDYTGDYICVMNRFGDTKYIASDCIEEIKEYKKMGYKIYGTKEEKIFNKSFIESDLKDLFKRYAEDNGYDDMEEQLGFDSEKYKRIEQTVKEYIESLGSINDTYYCDNNIIIEVE